MVRLVPTDAYQNNCNDTELHYGLEVLFTLHLSSKHYQLNPMAARNKTPMNEAYPGNRHIIIEFIFIKT